LIHREYTSPKVVHMVLLGLVLALVLALVLE
jgi:hypothetical protein